MKKIFLIFCMLLLSLVALSADVAVVFESQEIIEGENIYATFVRSDTSGDLSVRYEVGAPKIEFSGILASSDNNNNLRYIIDGNLGTSWCNNGNAKYSGKDDTPFLTFYFSEPSIVGVVKIANYANPWHTFRGFNDVIIEASKDGETFTEIMQVKCSRISDSTSISQFEAFAFPDEYKNEIFTALRLKALSNFATRFYEGVSYEGDYTNGSAVGITEFEASSIGVDKAMINHNNTQVIIPDGQDRVTVDIRTIDDSFIYGDRTIEIRLIDSEDYNLDRDYKSRAVVKDNDFGPMVWIEEAASEADFSSGQAGAITFYRNTKAGNTIIKYTTANEFLPYQYVSASSSHWGGVPEKLQDNSLGTNWVNSGNAKNESEEDDEPWVCFTFDDVYPIGMIKIANYVAQWHTFRGVREIEVLTAIDEYSFQSRGIATIGRTDDNATISVFQDITLNGIEARRVAFKILSNYSTEFYKGTSFEGDYANGSAVGIAEVWFFTGSSLNPADIEESIDNYIIIPEGQDHVTLSITPNKVVENKKLNITVLPDYTAYTLDFDKLSATINVK